MTRDYCIAWEHNGRTFRAWNPRSTDAAAIGRNLKAMGATRVLVGAVHTAATVFKHGADAEKLLS